MGLEILQAYFGHTFADSLILTAMCFELEVCWVWAYFSGLQSKEHDQNFKTVRKFKNQAYAKIDEKPVAFPVTQWGS